MPGPHVVFWARLVQHPFSDKESCNKDEQRLCFYFRIQYILPVFLHPFESPSFVEASLKVVHPQQYTQLTLVHLYCLFFR